MKVVESENTIDYPYCVISDVHLHNWSQFSHTLADGRNNRLQHILDAIKEAADALRKAGGKDLVITGDLFHTRGNVKPSVLNPAIDLFSLLFAMGIDVHSIPGNHDLEGRNSDTLGNAMHSLTSICNFSCYTVPTLLASKHLFIPWFEDSQEVLNLANKKALEKPNLTLFAHLGLSGVLPTAISNTLNPTDFHESLKYVFCGHFHNHTNFHDRVFSVGALTHQTWSDIGSKAGYLIVYEDRVEHAETNAPTFMESDFSSGCNPLGSFVRIKGAYSKPEAEREVARLKAAGTLAVLDQTTRPTLVERKHESAVEVDLGLDTALETYCKHTFGDNWRKVYDECVELQKKT